MGEQAAGRKPHKLCLTDINENGEARRKDDQLGISLTHIENMNFEVTTPGVSQGELYIREALNRQVSKR